LILGGRRYFIHSQVGEGDLNFLLLVRQISPRIHPMEGDESFYPIQAGFFRMDRAMVQAHPLVDLVQNLYVCFLTLHGLIP
jgi:hypothetical protein